jgi:hypothetical protein
MIAISLNTFQEMCKAQKMPPLHVAFKCPRCGTVQSAFDLISAGVGKTLDDVYNYIGYVCVGRFKGSKFSPGDPPGNGCDYEMIGTDSNYDGILISLPNGTEFKVFKLASDSEAIEHAKKNGITFGKTDTEEEKGEQ